MAVQYSKAAGFYTLAITHSKDKEDLASKLGADLIVSNGERLNEARGADVILATSNSYKAASESLKGLRPDGRMVLMGFSTEPLIVTSEIIGNRSRIIGSTQNSQEYLYEALDYVAKGKVKVIAETYPLHDIARAYENVAAGNVRAVNMRERVSGNIAICFQGYDLKTTRRSDLLSGLSLSQESWRLIITRVTPIMSISSLIDFGGLELSGCSKTLQLTTSFYQQEQKC